MAISDQEITETHAAYCGDCIEVMPSLRDGSVHLSVYSPPFASLYEYSSSDHDLSNCQTYEQFLEHFEYVIREIERVTVHGRISAVHCMDLKDGSGLRDFPGDIIRLHEKNGFKYVGRHCIWKEPLRVAIRTRALHLMHRQLTKDSSLSSAAGADYVLVFRKGGTNPLPIAHPSGLSDYAGEREIPPGLEEKYGHGWSDPKTNKLSHWIWQQYASSFWDDIRVSRVLPYREARETDEEKHVCPLQLDVIERCLTLWSNPGEVVLTPFMGVGSEVYCAVRADRRAIGIELKPSYFRQALKNIHEALSERMGQLALDIAQKPSFLEEDDEPAVDMELLA